MTQPNPTRSDLIVFLVHLPASQDPVVFARARDREEAKRLARPILQRDPDWYIVSPLTRSGAEVHTVGPPREPWEVLAAARSVTEMQCRCESNVDEYKGRDGHWHCSLCDGRTENAT